MIFTFFFEFFFVKVIPKNFTSFFIYLFLIGNQKKAQESHDENVKMVEDALKEKEQVFTQICSNLLKNFYLAIFFLVSVGIRLSKVQKRCRK